MICKFKTKQNYVAYRIPKEDILELRKTDLFGNLCDSCNCIIEETYFIPVLNWGMCCSCFEEWESAAMFYTEDIEVESNNIETFEYHCHILGLQIIEAFDGSSNSQEKSEPNVWSVELTSDDISALAVCIRTHIQKELDLLIYDLEHGESDKEYVCVVLGAINRSVNAYNQIDTTPKDLTIVNLFGSKEKEEKYYSLIDEYKEINE